MAFEPHRSLLTALRTLTTLRLPGQDAGEYARALPWFPVAGLLIGAVAMSVVWLLAGTPVAWPAGAAVAAVLAVTLLTGGLHLDGLGDAADAIGGGWTRERRLQIMKDTHVGAMAVMAIALSLVWKVVALAALAEAQDWWLIPLPFMLARLVQVQLICTLPYARAENGTGAPFVKGARKLHIDAAIILSAALAWVLGHSLGLGLAAVALLTGLLLADWMRRFVGGVTGDLLGFGSEVTENLLLAVLVCVLRVNAGG